MVAHLLLHFWTRWLHKKILDYPNTKVIGLDRDINSELIGEKLRVNFQIVYI